MICNTIQDALNAAEQAQKEGLQGLYPSACIIMAEYIKREQQDIAMLIGSVTERELNNQITPGAVVYRHG